MDDPQICSVCRSTLIRLKHRTAHHHFVNQDARIRTCPHNLGEDRYEGPRHDEWHLTDNGWVKREE